MSTKAQYGPLYWDLRGYYSIPNYRNAMHSFSNKELLKAIVILDSINSIFVKEKNYRKQYLVQNEKAAMFYISKEYSLCRDLLQNNLKNMISNNDTLNYEYAISLRFMGYLANQWIEMKTPKQVYMERQLSVLEAMKDKSEIYADCLSDLGLTYIYNDPEKGMDYLLASKKISKNFLSTYPVLIIDNTLANCLSIEQPHLSLKIQTCLYETASRKYYRDSTALIMLAYHIGSKNREIGQYHEGLKYLEYANEIMRATNNPFHKLITAIPVEKIQCYGMLKDELRFAKEVEKTLSRYYLTSENKNWPEYYLLGIIGNSYLEFNTDSAMKYLEKSEKLILKEEEKDIEMLGKIINSLALAYKKTGNMDKAIDKIFESIKLFTGEDPFHLPNFICNVGNDELLKESYLIASELLYESIKQKFSQENYNLAIKTMLCSDTLMRKLAITISDQNEILTYAKEYKMLTSFLLDIPNITQKNPELAFHFVSNSKGFQLFANIKREACAENIGLNDSIWSAKNKIEKEIHLVQIEYNVALQNSQKDIMDSLKVIEKDLLVDLLVLNYKIMKRQKNEEFYFNNDNMLSELISNMKDSTLIIDIFETKDNYYVFSINKSGLSCQKYPNAKKINELANKLYKEIKTGDKYNSSAKTISTILLSPISHKIEMAQNITFIPDNILYQIPLEILPNPKNGKMLILSHNINYHYSSNLWIKSNSTSSPNQHKMFSFAPGFIDNSSLDLSSNFRDVNFKDSELSTFDKEKICPLPYTLIEANEISTLFSKKGIYNKLITNKEATKNSFINIAKEATIIHIATHGYVSKSTPENSGIFTYSSNSTVDVLNMKELYNLDTKADLVVLSACNSGVGPIYEGEGLIALPRGFIYAGVPNVLASLWKIHDEKTKVLMLFFYQHLITGDSYSQALRKAKIECIRKGFLPLDWAGFVLIGR